MFSKWKKRSSSGSLTGRSKEGSFVGSRDSIALTSPSAASVASAGANAAGLFVQDYRGANETQEPKDVASHAPASYTPTSSGPSQTFDVQAGRDQYEQLHSRQSQLISQRSHHSQHSAFEQMMPVKAQSFHHFASPRIAPAESTNTLAANLQLLELEAHTNTFEHNNRLLCTRINELKQKHAQLLAEVKAEEEERQQFQDLVNVLKSRLAQVTETLQQQLEVCGTVDKLIEETEDGYSKIVETSKTILQMLDNDYSQLFRQSQRYAEQAF